jgi:hypothetical protein
MALKSWVGVLWNFSWTGTWHTLYVTFSLWNNSWMCISCYFNFVETVLFNIEHKLYGCLIISSSSTVHIVVKILKIIATQLFCGSGSVWALTSEDTALCITAAHYSCMLFECSWSNELCSVSAYFISTLSTFIFLVSSSHVLLHLQWFLSFL